MEAKGCSSRRTQRPRSQPSKAADTLVAGRITTRQTPMPLISDEVGIPYLSAYDLQDWVTSESHSQLTIMGERLLPG